MTGGMDFSHTGVARRFQRGWEGADAYLEKGSFAERAKERRASEAGNPA
jgi:hypothetical protein